MNTILYLILISLCGIANAVYLPVVSRPLARRQMMAGGKPAAHMQQVAFTQNVENARDIVYATNITLGGHEFAIQLDTGSSDLWVMPPFPLEVTNTTDIPASLTFGIGAVNGTVAFADMTFGPYEVQSQAFLNATAASSFSDILSQDIFGILGLCFDLASTVFVETAVKTNSTVGQTFLTNVFKQNPNSPNLFTILLGRSFDNDGPQEGAFTIGEYVTEFEDVANQPKLFRTPAQTNLSAEEPRWSVQMDSMTVNGKQFSFDPSSVPEAEPGKQVVVLDSGFTFSQIPPKAVDFIYSSIPGAVQNQTSGAWVVPCNGTASVSFEFGGQSYAVHPLDLTTTTPNGDDVICTNAYQPISLPAGVSAGFDFIMGDSFLKNAYISFDYGDFTPDNRTAGVPYVQMLPLTDPTDALNEFQSVRSTEVTAAEQLLQPTSTANATTAGSLAVLTQGLKNALKLAGLSKRTISVPEAREPRVFRVVYSTNVPVKQRITRCVKGFSAAYGPIITALLLGSGAVVVALCVIGLIMGARRVFGKRATGSAEGRRARIQLEKDVLFDADEN